MPNHFPSRVLSVSLLALTLAACSGDSEPQSLIIENPFHGPDQDTGRYELVVEELVQFGVEEEPIEQILSSPFSVVEGLGGRVYIVDEGTRVMMFEADGTYAGSFGREGEGPGELSNAFGIVASPSGTLLVLNQSGQRLDFFTADGRFLESVTREELGLDGYLGPVYIGPDSTVIFSGGIHGEIGTRVVHVDMQDGAIIDSFRVVEEREPGLPEGFTAGGSVAVVDERVIITNAIRYEMGLYSLQGDTLRIARRDVSDFTRPGFASFGSGFSMRRYSIVYDPKPLEGGYHLVSSSWATNISDPDEHARLASSGADPVAPDFHRSLDIFDSEWNLLFSVENEDREALNLGQIAHTIAPGEFHIIRYRPHPHIVRVRIRVEENG